MAAQENAVSLRPDIATQLSISIISEDEPSTTVNELDPLLRKLKKASDGQHLSVTDEEFCRWSVAAKVRKSILGTTTMIAREIDHQHDELEALEDANGVNYCIIFGKALLAFIVLCAYSAEPILFYFTKTEGAESYGFSVASVFCVSTFIIAFGTWAFDGFKWRFWTHFTMRDFCIFAIVRFLGDFAHIIRPLSLVYLGVGPFVVISSLQVVANAALHYIVERHAISTNQGVSIFILLMALVAFQGDQFANGGNSFLYGFFLLTMGLIGLGLAHVFGERYLKEVFKHYDFTDAEKLCVTNTFDLIGYIILMFIMDWDIIKTGIFTGWTFGVWLVTIDYVLIFCCGIMTLMYLSAVIYALIITGAVAFSYLGDLIVFGKPFTLDHFFLMIVIVSLVIAYQVDGATQFYIEQELHHAEIEAREHEAERILAQYLNLKRRHDRGQAPRKVRHTNVLGLPTTCIGQKDASIHPNPGSPSEKKAI